MVGSAVSFADSTRGRRQIRALDDPAPRGLLPGCQYHAATHAPWLHDRGVALLPVWAVEYSVLRQPARAFVSAMRPGPDPKVAGVTHYGAHALRYAVRVSFRVHPNPNRYP